MIEKIWSHVSHHCNSGRIQLFSRYRHQIKLGSSFFEPHRDAIARGTVEFVGPI